MRRTFPLDGGEVDLAEQANGIEKARRGSREPGSGVRWEELRERTYAELMAWVLGSAI